MQKFKSILSQVVCWLGALSAFGWAMMFMLALWDDFLDSSFTFSHFFDRDAAVYWLMCLGMIVLGAYLSIVAIRSFYLGKGEHPSRRILFIRRVAVVMVYVLSFIPQLLLVVLCPSVLVLGIVGIASGKSAGLFWGGLAIVTAFIPGAIFLICCCVLKNDSAHQLDDNYHRPVVVSGMKNHKKRILQFILVSVLLFFWGQFLLLLIEYIPSSPHSRYEEPVVGKQYSFSDLYGKIAAIHFLDDSVGYVFTYHNMESIANEINSKTFYAYKTFDQGETWEFIYKEDSVDVLDLSLSQRSWMKDSVVHFSAQKKYGDPFREIQYLIPRDTLVWKDENMPWVSYQFLPKCDSILAKVEDYSFVSDMAQSDSLMVAIVGYRAGLGTLNDVIYSLDNGEHWNKLTSKLGHYGPICVVGKTVFVVDCQQKLQIYVGLPTPSD